jgi:glycerol-3-phosphate acyltransferase PlsY
MPSSLVVALALIAAYLIGSVDFAVVVSRMHGVDIHEEGSGNPGVSNVLRVLGRGPAAIVFIGDTLKGTIGAAVGMIASGIAFGAVDLIGTWTIVDPWVWAAGFFAVLGHCYPVFHGLRGGKGVATGGGVLLFTVPLVAVIGIVTWGIVVRLTRTASIGSMLVVITTIPLLLWQGVRGAALIWASLLILLVVWRHRGNIGRMIKGSEEKVPT